jgi:uncharacterized membrane protein
LNPLNESSPKSATTANDLLSAGETLALLDRLRQSLREAVQRTAELDKDFTLRANKLRAQLEQSLAAERARWTTESDQLSADKATQEQHIEDRFKARKGLITRALENARAKRLAQIEGEEGKHTFDNQRELLDNERAKEVDTQKNNASYQSFTGELANERAALDQLSRRARATFSGFGSLARLINHPPTGPALDPKADENQLLDQLREQRDRAARALTRTNALVLPVLFRFLRLWIGIPLIIIAAFLLVPELRRFDFQHVPTNVWAIVGGSVLAFLVLQFLGKLLACQGSRSSAAVRL